MSFALSLVFWILVAAALAAASFVCSGLYLFIATVVLSYLPDNIHTFAEDTQLHLEDRYRIEFVLFSCGEKRFFKSGCETFGAQCSLNSVMFLVN